ncbi:MAG: UDP-N-acetylmuramoyl-L-alanyl-D-glutamate--2,6-diaminopimelate ligase [bacterium]
MRRRLAELVEGVPCTVLGDRAVEIGGIAYHSGQVRPGWLFVAIEGFRVSGSRYVEDAVRRGAAAVATSRPEAAAGGRVTVVETENPRRFLAEVANRFHDFPARRLELVGITGTNGKTTTAYLLRAVCRHRGFEPGLVGTVEHSDGRVTSRAGQTTPESLDFVELLARMVANRVPVCVAEVSSHALALDRAHGLDFRVGVFTNLTQDHLDFHRTLDEYRDAKMRLFAGLGPDASAVTNLDDPVGAAVAGLTRARVLTYGTGADGSRPDIAGRVTGVAADALDVEVIHAGRTLAARLKLAGRHNLWNLLAAFGAGLALGWEPGEILRGAETLASVPGRLERVANSRGFDVFVDYAHTPDALERVLATVREFTAGRVIAVFGCGGDRDRGKRPLMGRAAARGADLAVVTSDNPRSEEPEAIIAEIVAGMDVAGARLVLPDREKAIRRALAAARPGDSVVIAGKGHEDYQLVGSERRRFDDRSVARGLLEG